MNDLDLRARQLETHLLASPEYVSTAVRKVKWLVALLCVVIILFLFEALFCLDEPKPTSPVVLGSIDVTSFVAIACCVLIIRTRRWFRRLNEKWLNSDAKKTLETLRREQAELQSHGHSPSAAR